LRVNVTVRPSLKLTVREYALLSELPDDPERLRVPLRQGGHLFIGRPCTTAVAFAVCPLAATGGVATTVAPVFVTTLG